MGGGTSIGHANFRVALDLHACFLVGHFGNCLQFYAKYFVDCKALLLSFVSNEKFIHSLLSGALLSYFLQPVYLSSVTVGRSPNSPEKFLLEDCLKRALYDRIQPLRNKLMSPFRVNQVCKVCYYLCNMETWWIFDNNTLIPLAANILGCPSTTKGVPAFWVSFEHFDMRVLQLNLISSCCTPYPIIVWLLRVFVYFYSKKNKNKICFLWLPGIQYVGISLACLKWFLEPLEESKAPLPKEHFIHLLSPLYASKLTNILKKSSPVEGINHHHHYYCAESGYWRFSCH